VRRVTRVVLWTSGLAIEQKKRDYSKKNRNETPPTLGNSDKGTILQDGGKAGDSFKKNMGCR